MERRAYLRCASALARSHRRQNDGAKITGAENISSRRTSMLWTRNHFPGEEKKAWCSLGPTTPKAVAERPLLTVVY